MNVKLQPCRGGWPLHPAWHPQLLARRAVDTGAPGLGATDQARVHANGGSGHQIVQASTADTQSLIAAMGPVRREPLLQVFGLVIRVWFLRR